MRAVDQEFLRPKGFIVLTCNYVAEHSDTRVAIAQKKNGIACGTRTIFTT